MIHALLLSAAAAACPPPSFAQTISPILEDAKAGMARTAEFMQQEHGKEFGPLWLDLQSFVEAGQDIEGFDLDRADVEAMLDLPFQDATYKNAVRRGPKSAPATEWI
jgi:hypothetical protein